MSQNPEFNRAQEVLFKLPLAVLAENEERKISFANQFFCDLFAIPASPEQLTGMDCAGMANESKAYFKDPEHFLAYIHRAISEQKDISEEELELVDGRFLAASYIPYYQGKEFAGHIWTYKDISSRKLAEQELQKQRAFAAEILDSLPADIAIFDAQHRYIYLNKTAIKNPELRNWIIGKDDFDYCAHRAKDVQIATLRRAKFNEALKTGKQVEWEDSSVGTEGQTDYILRKFNPLFDQDKNFKFMVGYGVTINKLKQAERELMKGIQKEQELNELQSRFVNMVSHEIRTPMAGIFSSVELLELLTSELDEPLKTKTDKHLNRIKNQVTRVTDLMNDVLLMGKMEAGKIPFRPESIDLLPLINEVIEQQLGEKNPHRGMKLVITGTPRMAKLDGNLLKNILQNLISNAFKYSADKPNPYIHIHYLAKKIELEIIDYGIGIPLAEQKDVFTAFMRGSNSGNIEGTGLGLVVVKNFVHIHGGKVSFKSKPNVGTTFKLSLPA